MQTGYAARKFVRSALLGLLFTAPLLLPVHAAVVDIATAPLYNSTTSLVKPNLLFILDDSSSMDYNYLPDEVPRDNALIGNPNTQTDTHAVALTSSQCNGVAYNPNIAYAPPVDSSGTAMTQHSVTAAPSNGYNTSSPTTNLASPSQFYYVYGNGGTESPLKYEYESGLVKTNTLFYQECNSPTTNAPRFTKVLVSSLSAAAKQNYANWYSYYRTRLLMMKTLAGQSFQTLTNSFRVGFSTMHDTGADESATFLPIADFAAGSGGQKEKFFTKLYAVSANSGAVPQQYTPARGALSKAGRLYAGKFFSGGTSPADLARDPVQYSCQQNFALMASDGYWNSSDDTTSHGAYGLNNMTPVGDRDGPNTTPATAPPQYDNLGVSNSLADVAMYYYQTDLRNPDNCASGATGANLCPTDSGGQYAPNVPGTSVDNNVKPHMTTMTVGLAINGLLGYSPSYATDTTGHYYEIKTGQRNWPDPRTSTTFPYDGTSKRQVIERVDDLWHAAVNGRGSYFSAKNPTTLVSGLKGALAGVASRLGYGAAGATSSLAPVAGNNSLFVASYTTGQWTGNLVAESIDIVTGNVNPAPTWCAEDIAADPVKGTAACVGRLAFQVGASSDSRTIYFNSSGTLNSFTYTNLPATLKSYFDNTKLSQYNSTWTATDKSTATGTTLVNFLRGHSQYESQDGSTANLYRKRNARLGDIVDNQPVFVGKPYYAFADPGYTAWKNASAQQNRAKTVFVGANDGMLHAFNADTGDERWAFVPTPVMPKMYWLADLNYAANHHNYVNGRLVWSDVCVANCTDAGQADWRTILMGALNGGGRGIYALDVTNPAAPALLWEFTSLNDADFGYSFGNPLAVKKANGTWVVLVSSGYDNVSLGNGDPYDAAGTGRGFLYVINPLNGSVIDKIPTGEGDATTPSGLARMAYWADSPEQDATALYAYGGDLLGNLWRFDINTQAVVRLATFTDDASIRQPITTRPELTKVGVNRMVFTSTGKYLEVSDLDSANFRTQSLYAIVDNGTTLADPRSLAKRTLVNARPIRTVTKDDKDPALGWFVDFPDSGERSNVDMVLVRGTLLVPTNVPTNGICDAGGYSWLNYLNYATGSFVSGANTAAIWTGNDLTTGINVVLVGGVPKVIRTGSGTGPGLVPTPAGGGGSAGVRGHRVGWREIIAK